MTDEPPDQEPFDEGALLGAVDIVEAFTALRHELKLQVRAGRELSSGIEQAVAAALEEPLAAIAAQLGDLQTHVTAAGGRRPPHEAVTGEAETSRRLLATAMAEAEESLERAVAAVTMQADTLRHATASNSPDNVDGSRARSDELDTAWAACVQQAPWAARWLAAGLLTRLRAAAGDAASRAHRDGGQQVADAFRNAGDALADARQGLELVLLRIRRLMEKAGLARLRVAGNAFDPETMRAVEAAPADGALPGSVIEEVRPGYAFEGSVLRPADVRVAR